MVRTSFATGVIFPALAAVSACGEDGCPRDMESCNGLCVRLPSDPFNCGACGVSCEANGVCRQGSCEPGCDTGQTACGATCVDLQVDSAHCGDCAVACEGNAACVTGQCAVPLAVLQTSRNDREIDRDVYVLENVTLDLTKLDQATFATSRVIDHAILPDGSVVIVAAETTEGTFELYRVAADGGPVTKLNPPLPAGANVQAGVVVSRDGKSLLYRADQDTVGTNELYLVSLATPGQSTKVNGPLVAGGNVSRVFAISSGGSRVTYIADQDTDGLDEVYTTAVGTPGVTKVNAPVVNSVFDFQATDDGAVVVYRVPDPSTGAPLLNVVATANPGLADPILTTPDGLNGRVENYRVARDGSAVIFSSTQNFLAESLYRAPLASPFTPVQFVDGSAGGVRADFVVTANGARVFFRQVDVDGVKRLYRVDVADPASRTQLSPAGKGSDADVPDFALSRDEKTLAFRTGSDGPEGGFGQPGTDTPFFFDDKTQAIFAIDLTAAAPNPVQLNPPFNKGNEGVGAGYVVTRDGRVLYRADHDTSGSSEAYLADKATPGASRKVSPELAPADATDVSVLSSF